MCSLRFIFYVSTVVLKFSIHNLCLCFKFNQHMYNQIPFLYCLNTIKTVNNSQTLGTFYVYFCFNMKIQKVMQGQRKSKLNTFHVITGMLTVYQLKSCPRFPKLKHTIHSIVTILSVYQEHTFINQYQKKIEIFNQTCQSRSSK